MLDRDPGKFSGFGSTISELLSFAVAECKQPIVAAEGAMGHGFQVSVRPGLVLEVQGPIQEGGDQSLELGLGDEQGEGKGDEDSNEELQEGTGSGEDSIVNKVFLCSFVPFLHTVLGAVWRLLVLTFLDSAWWYFPSLRLNNFS